MAAASSHERHIELPRGLRVRVLSSSQSGHGFAIDAVVRRLGADNIALGVHELPERAESLIGEPVMLAAQLHGRIYTLDATVLGTEQVPRALIVSLPTEARRAERRSFYRLNRVIDVEGTWEEPSPEGEGAPPAVHQLSEARLLDISGGGALLRTHEAIPPGAVIRLEIALDGEAAGVSVVARALRVQDEERRHAYRINTEFEGISRRTQEQIVRFIFKQQALLSRRRIQ